MNNNKFTYEKFKTPNFGFSTFDFFGQVLLKLFTFLMNTDKDIYNIYSFSILLLYYKLSNTHNS